MLSRSSLRLRLLVLILLPLCVISVAAMGWRYSEARITAQEIFDRNLLIMGYAVARDVALSGGDTLAPATQEIFKSASGGDVFYHVYGPDGSFVTGYSSPPVTDLPVPVPNDPVQQYDARHQGEPVRVARLSELASIDEITGRTVVTVWQRLDHRDAFVRQTALQAGAVVLLLLASVAGLVMFGIGLGLRPLIELEEAIQKRSSADLSPILRQVPPETRGIVARLNSLFAQVTDAQAAQQRFVSLAAHQLRNPVAAIHTMAEATLNAQTIAESHARAETLVGETRAAMRLTNQLLAFERLKGAPPEFSDVDLVELVRGLVTQFAPRAIAAGVECSASLPDAPVICSGDAVLLKEAIANLVDNALVHGGATMGRLALEVRADGDGAVVMVENDGNRLSRAECARLFERFAQGDGSKGSGLGLSISRGIAELHGGRLRLVGENPVRFALEIPDVARG